MRTVSIFNDVLGPVMFGPSSSHTAGSYHIGKLAADLLGEPVAEARLVFDPAGSYAQLYREQGSDLAFAAGLLGWQITDARFHDALSEAAGAGVRIEFAVEPLPRADHPNTVDIRLLGSRGRTLHLLARSVGGGAIEVIELNGQAVYLSGDSYVVVVRSAQGRHEDIRAWLQSQGYESVITSESIVVAHAPRALHTEIMDGSYGIEEVWTARPVFYPHVGAPTWRSAAELLAMAEAEDLTLGLAGLRYESTVLGLGEDEVHAEVLRRYDVMRESVRSGLALGDLQMQLLRPSAASIMRKDGEGALAIGGIHTRTAARAMAVMHVNGAMGRLCAAPTAGSAGVLPGVLVTLEEERGVDSEQIALGLLAAGAIGVVIAERATFAAEVAGCQVEIGASGAMAAAAVVDIFGGSARQACDAAAISLQNTMGMVCDLVQGIVEIPCHTRNAVAASSAFVCADLVMGGYENPVPLDETVDAVYAVGKMLPPELRCTSKGGLAVTPSARNLKRLRVL